MLAGVAGIVAGAFLPWVVSGQTTRNSFTTVQVARTLGVVDEGLAVVALGAWFFVPVTAVATVVLVVLGRRRVGGALALALGVASVAFAVLVLRGPIETAAGVKVTFAAGLASCVATVMFLAGPGRRGNVRPGR